MNTMAENKQKRFYKKDERVRIIEKETFGYVENINRAQKEMTVSYRGKDGRWETITGKFWEFDKDRSINDKKPKFNPEFAITSNGNNNKINIKNNNKVLKVTFTDDVIDGLLPSYGTEHSAGLDFYSNNEQPITIKVGEKKKIGTGLKVQIPDGYFGAIYPRSSAGAKLGLRLANTVGIIDADYRGEITLVLINEGDKDVIINRGDRIVQMIIQPYYKLDVEHVIELDSTERGEGGYGSTGR